MRQITTLEALEALYQPAPVAASTVKVADHITPHYATLIEASPFLALATVGPEGLDCSPRGDLPGFVRIADPKTLMLPDRRGNNRIDTLRNLVRDPRISLLFLIPGVGETLRINGRARISRDPALCSTFMMQGKVPQTVLIVTIDRVYFQCPKALVRSKLWSPEVQIPRTSLPSTGQIMQAITAGGIDGAALDAAYPQRLRDTIY